MKIRLTVRALSDLQEIGDYLDSHNPGAARNVRHAIQATFEMLRMFPNVGRAQNLADVRKFTTRRYGYLVYYRVSHERGEILVLTIQHGRRRRAIADT